MQKREKLLDTLNRLEKNPATAHLMVRATKGRKMAPQERLLKRVLRGAEVAAEAVANEDYPSEGAGSRSAQPAACVEEDNAFREAVINTCSHEAAEVPVEARKWMSTIDVKSYVGISSATLYRLINEQGFPRPRKLGKLSRWMRDEIDAYMMALPVMVIPKIDWIDGKKPKKK